MGTDSEVKAKRTRGPRVKKDAVFVTKSDIAQMMNIGNTKTIDAWIANGSFPPPHSRPGPLFAVWLRKHWDVYVETGKWPKDAFPKY